MSETMSCTDQADETVFPTHQTRYETWWAENYKCRERRITARVPLEAYIYLQFTIVACVAARVTTKSLGTLVKSDRSDHRRSADRAPTHPRPKLQATYGQVFGAAPYLVSVAEDAHGRNRQVVDCIDQDLQLASLLLGLVESVVQSIECLADSDGEWLKFRKYLIIVGYTLYRAPSPAILPIYGDVVMMKSRRPRCRSCTPYDLRSTARWSDPRWHGG